VTPSSPGRRFAPQWHWTLLALAGIALFASLGRWQLHRAEEKRALFEGFAAGNLEAVDLPGGLTPVERYRRVRASGRYDAGRQFLLDNMPRDGVPGVHVLTPLVRDDGSVVIVDRGWIAIGGDRAALPALPVDGAPRTVTGRADALPRPAVELEAPPGSGWPRLVSFPTTAQLAAALGAAVHPQVLLLDEEQPEGFVRDWRPPGMTPDKHVGYAIQWFGLAAAVAGTWLVLSFRPGKESK
jgi:surfeit locus 1 family protein